MGVPNQANLAAGINVTGTTTGRIPSSTKATSAKPKGKHGFASMTPERQREIASMGGRAAHRSGNAHEYNSETGRAASLKRRDRNAPQKSAQ